MKEIEKFTKPIALLECPLAYYYFKSTLSDEIYQLRPNSEARGSALSCPSPCLALASCSSRNILVSWCSIPILYIAYMKFVP